mmetsp:Transcript_51491/g.85529  ORF Transcript_51491/g.85529 Transcript_51491/m.85529 type:complete len:613 (+) Transcript_51491:698-2536(+)
MRAEDLQEGMVGEVGGGVVGPDGVASLVVDDELDLLVDLERAVDAIRRVAADVEDKGSAVELHVTDLEEGRAVGTREGASVMDLTSLFGIEVGGVEEEAIDLADLIDRIDKLKAVPDGLEGGADWTFLVLGLVVSGEDEMGGLEVVDDVDVEVLKVSRSIALCPEEFRVLAELLVALHGLFVLGEVDGHAALLGHADGEVDGEAVSVVEDGSEFTRDLEGGGLALDGLVEALDASLEQLLKRLFLGEEDLLDLADVLGVDEVGEGVLEGLSGLGHQLTEETSRGSQQISSITSCSSQDPPDDRSAVSGRRTGAVSEGDEEGADVVSDDTVSGVEVLVGGIVSAVLARVRVGGAGHFLDTPEDLLEHVDVVVAHLLLQNRRDPLQSHSSVDVFGGKGVEGLGVLAVVLDEDKVPDLNDLRVVHVHQVGDVSASHTVVVDLSAWSTWPSEAHLPEVLLHAKGKDAGGRDADEVDPEVAGLSIRLEVELSVAAKVGDVETGRVEAIDRGQKLPSPLDGLGLEVVPEGPVAEHLEEGVVVRVLSHVVQVVVLSSSPDALLGVGGSLQLSQVARGIGRPQEDWLELVHACVGELDGGVVVRDHTRRPHKVVSFSLKE